jgi:hypothetical protein
MFKGNRPPDLRLSAARFGRDWGVDARGGDFFRNLQMAMDADSFGAWC